MIHESWVKYFEDEEDYKEKILSFETKPTVDDLEWLVTKVRVERGKFVYYMNKCRFELEPRIAELEKLLEQNIHRI